ncbi:hypothetical protein [Yoonia sp. SS1-5]|uniref:Uncharacterized protein n=1 Tax=Yoonia rhodophyticola TaxID=3137370 RepID=A0AAN0M9E8_9RHOB
MQSKSLDLILEVRNFREKLGQARLASARRDVKRKSVAVQEAEQDLQSSVANHYKSVEKSLRAAEETKDPQARFAVVALALSRGRRAIRRAEDDVNGAHDDVEVAQSTKKQAGRTLRQEAIERIKLERLKDKLEIKERREADMLEEDEFDEVATVMCQPRGRSA